MSGLENRARIFAYAWGSDQTNVPLVSAHETREEAAIHHADGDAPIVPYVREDTILDVVQLRRSLVQLAADFAEDKGHAAGLRHAIACLDDAVTEANARRPPGWKPPKRRAS